MRTSNVGYMKHSMWFETNPVNDWEIKEQYLRCLSTCLLHYFMGEENILYGCIFYTLRVDCSKSIFHDNSNTL